MIPYAECCRANHEGRMAVAVHRIAGGPPPQSPYRAHTKLGRYWNFGARQAANLLDQLMENAP